LRKLPFLVTFFVTAKKHVSLATENYFRFTDSYIVHFNDSTNKPNTTPILSENFILKDKHFSYLVNFFESTVS